MRFNKSTFVLAALASLSQALDTFGCGFDYIPSKDGSTLNFVAACPVSHGATMHSELNLNHCLVNIDNQLQSRAE